MKQMMITILFGAATAALTVWVLSHLLTLNVHVGMVNVP